MNRLFLCVCVILPCALLSCSEKRCPTEPDCGNFCYPLTVGNRWEYSRVDSLFNFRQDTTGVALLRASRTHTVEITRTEILFNCIETYVFRETATRESGESYESEAYYRNQKDGLYEYAYRGISWASPFAPRESRIRFKGRDFDSFMAVVSFIDRVAAGADIIDDSLRFNSPPIRVLRYPLEVGAQWVIREAGDPWRIEKRVIGKETVSVPAGDFRCYSIQTLIDLHDDGEWDEDVECIDYVSSAGLARRYMFLKDLLWTNEWGGVIGWFDVIDDSKLVEVHLE